MLTVGISMGARIFVKTARVLLEFRDNPRLSLLGGLPAACMWPILLLSEPRC